MKIYDIYSFEKLNIHPIKMSDISTSKKIDTPLFVEKIDDSKLHSINVNNLKYGWLLKTIDCSETLIWIYINYDLAIKLFGNNYGYYDDCIVCPCLSTNSKLSYLNISGFRNNFPKFITNKMEFPEFEINSVYKTNIDISLFESSRDILNLYDKYSLYDL